MSAFLNSSAAVAKTRAMYGAMLKENHYLELLSKQNISELVIYLKNNTTYKSGLENVNELTIHRGQLEIMLKKQVLENYEKICRYLDFAHNAVFQLILEEFEIFEILKLIRFLKSSTPEEYINHLPGFLIARCCINLLEMAKVRSFQGLLEVLKNTHYAEILISLLSKNRNETINFIECEYQLYIHFFNRFFSSVKTKAKNNNFLELQNIFKIKIDHLNISRIYREKFLFNSTAESLKKIIYPFYDKLNFKKIEQLIKLNNDCSLNEFLKCYSAKLYSKLENDSSCYIEKYLSEEIYKICKKYLHMSSNVYTVFYSFHIISQIELSNLIYIIEGIRYKINPEEIKKLLIY